jgi:spermidine synthase
LSATAPLIQSWFSRLSSHRAGEAPDAYLLYAASNLGSLAALVAYPVLVEPFSTLTGQRLGWSAGFALFFALILVIGIKGRFTTHASHSHTGAVAAPSTLDLLRWILLAAAPSSLMMGVTSYLTTDIASFPFMWVAPLALYLVTFIMAFQAKPWISREVILLVQSILVGLTIYFMPFIRMGLGWQLGLNLSSFFLTALVCHQTLADRRPDPQHLTTYYLCLSLGGVVGGSFNAFLAPVIFSTVIEYPLVLILACLARPWGPLELTNKERIAVALGLVGAALPPIMVRFGGAGLANSDSFFKVGMVLFVMAMGMALLVRNRAVYFTLIIAALWVSLTGMTTQGRNMIVQRSFFGVLKVAEAGDPKLGDVRLMYHGTTIHGAQGLAPARRCQPLTYYAPATGIGQTVTRLEQQHPALNMVVVGLGTGAIASYVRPTDHLSFFEIDPLVVEAARDPRQFTYVSQCAKSPVGFQTGDARLTLNHLPAGQLDLLMIDAFSSDTVPAHLLTVEAVRMYLSKLKPDGVLLLHLTNRHLELRDPVIAALEQAGARTLTQKSPADPVSFLTTSATTVVIASRASTSLAPFAADSRWSRRDPGQARAWTDDYSNLLGALVAGLQH